ncbi:MAG: hypothetical protein M9894_09270 [Planctomycetes bacterium]|nr:hypothetical protein [Planctomycetota bacterium]
MEQAKDKPLARPAPPPEVAPRDDVRAATSPVRCPFCHDEVAVEAAGWVACTGCLARHHAACWREGGRCGACGRTEAMTPPRQTRWLGTVGVLLAFLLLVVATLFVAWKPAAEERSRAAAVAREEEAQVQALIARSAWQEALDALASHRGALDAPTLAALEARCRRELEAERLYNEAADLVGIRSDLDRAEALFRQVDPTTRLAREARAYVDWIAADRQLRKGRTALQRGQPWGLPLLEAFLPAQARGPHRGPTLSDEVRRWREVLALDALARARLAAGDATGAREALQRVGSDLMNQHAFAMRARALTALLVDVDATRDPGARLRAGLDALAAGDDGAALAWLGAARAADPALSPEVHAVIEAAAPEVARRVERSISGDVEADAEAARRLLVTWAPLHPSTRMVEALLPDDLRRGPPPRRTPDEWGDDWGDGWDDPPR